MNKKFFAVIVLCILGTLPFATSHITAGEHAHGHDHDHGHDNEHGGGHKAPHGGSLNVIEKCAIGHMEVKVEEDTLLCWFVGGDNATETAVRLKVKEIPLILTTDGGNTFRTLTLEAKPIVLAEETIGDCSHFVATAPFLKDIEEFIAIGIVEFKGTLRVLRITYPKGFDPDHACDDEDCDDHDH